MKFKKLQRAVFGIFVFIFAFSGIILIDNSIETKENLDFSKAEVKVD